MKYYLSGAISSQPDFVEYFKAHEKLLRENGLCDEIFNPGNVKDSVDLGDDPSWMDYMKYDIKQLMDCDILVLLPNWENSEGAKVEKYLCEKVGINIIEFDKLIEALKKLNS